MSKRSASKRRRAVVGPSGTHPPDEKRQRGSSGGPQVQARTEARSRPNSASAPLRPTNPPANAAAGAGESVVVYEGPASESLDSDRQVASDASTRPLPARIREASNSTVLMAVRDLEAAARRMTGDGLDDVWPGEAGTGLVRWRAWPVVPLLVVGALCRRLWRGVRNHGVLLVASVVSLALMAALGTFAVGAVARGVRLLPLAAGTVVAPATPPTTGVLVLQPPAPTPTSTSPAGQTPSAAYKVGAWVSNNAPPPSGTVKVYVRVTDYADFTPVPGATVTLSVLFTCSTGNQVAKFGPATTDANGLAIINVTYGGLPIGDPVCVTATVKVNHQTYTATTTFAAS